MTVSARPWLDRIEPYTPGSKAATPAGSMASNESPLGASPVVAPAISRALNSIHRYPDPLATELRNELARVHGVSPDQIVVGNGSDELIYQLAWAYLADGGRVLCADPAYRMDEISALVVNADVVKVPLVDWRHDLDAMAEVDADIAYVVNPHNPTGTVRSRIELADFVARSRAGLVVVDEAYIDFADDPETLTAIPLLESGRVAVLRTFSKIHGLAGLRIGYLVAPREVVDLVRKIRAPFSVGSLSQAGALAGLSDVQFRDRHRASNARIRGEVVSLLVGAGFSPVPSQANFVYVPTDDEQGFVAQLAEHGVSVRGGSTLGAPGGVRLSIPGDAGLALLDSAISTIASRDEQHA